MTWFDEVLSVLEQNGVSRETIYEVAKIYLAQREFVNKNGQEAFVAWAKNPGVTNIKSAFIAGFRCKNL